MKYPALYTIYEENHTCRLLKILWYALKPLYPLLLLNVLLRSCYCLAILAWF